MTRSTWRRIEGILCYVCMLVLALYLIYWVLGAVIATFAGIWVAFMIATVIGEIWFDE